MHILLPLDGSLRAETVLHPLTVLARRATAPLTVTLVTVLAPNQDDHHVDAYLHAMQQHPDLATLTVHLHRVTDQPATGICRAAHDTEADLILMASHMTTLDPETGTSVAETVARCAIAPTLVIRPEGLPLPDVPRYAPLTLGVVVESPLAASAAYAPCVRFAAVFDADIILLAEQGHNAETQYQALTTLAREMGHAGMAVSRLLLPHPLGEHINGYLHTGRLAVVAIPLAPEREAFAPFHPQSLLGDVSAPTLLFHAVVPGSTSLPLP